MNTCQEILINYNKVYTSNHSNWKCVSKTRLATTTTIRINKNLDCDNFGVTDTPSRHRRHTSLPVLLFITQHSVQLHTSLIDLRFALPWQPWKCCTLDFPAHPSHPGHQGNPSGKIHILALFASSGWKKTNLKKTKLTGSPFGPSRPIGPFFFIC
jgi:hypothetical protein